MFDLGFYQQELSSTLTPHTQSQGRQIKALFKTLAFAVLLSTFLLPQDQFYPAAKVHSVELPQSEAGLPNNTGESAPRSLTRVWSTGENQKR